jgi:hypothetical protein
MHLLTTDPTTLNILLAIPSAIIAVGSIFNFLYNLNPREPGTQSQPAPPGYYRNRIIRLIIYIFLAFYTAFIAVLYVAKRSPIETVLFYSFLAISIISILLIPFSIYATFKKL